MKIPNFNSISQSNKWVPDKRHHSQPRLFDVLIRRIRVNPILIVPHSIILTTTLVLLGTNLFYNSTKKELEPYHEQHIQLVDELNTLKSSNQELEKQYTPAYEFMVDSVHPFVFAKELQTLIPRDVQLKSYVLSKSAVTLEASSVMQRSLDDFIVLFANHPFLKKESLNILEITSTVQGSSTNFEDYGESNGSYTEQPKQLYNVKMTGEYQQPDQELLLQLLLKTGNIGLLEKIRAFKP